jgi:O-antigen/teichoic acid export membrane protein
MAGHTLWNLVGMGVPMLAGAIAFPIMLSERIGLGKERLEVLGLVWMLVGFSSIFDMGLGRALTKIVVEKLSRKEMDSLQELFWTALSMIATLGLITAGIILAVIPILTRNLGAELCRETRAGFLIVACAMPVVILNVALVGVLQAFQRFRMINLIHIPAGSLTFLAPLCVLPFTRNIAVVVLVLILVRVAEMMAYFVGSLYVLPVLRQGFKIDRGEARHLLGFGSWMTVSNIAVSLMTHINRFVIRTLRQIGEGAYYLIPEEIVVRLLMFPRAWIDVLFPAFVTSFHNSEDDPAELFDRGTIVLALVTFPICMLVAVFAPDVFAVWLPDGEVFAAKSAFVIRCLSIGVFVHGLARVSWFFVQAAGRPDLSAKLHLVEVPLYLLAAYAMIGPYGVDGAALVWSLRCGIDFLLLLLLAVRLLPHPGTRFIRITAVVVAGCVLMALSAWPAGLAPRLGACALSVGVLYAGSWFWALTAAERAYVLDQIQGRLSRSAK